MTIEFVAASVLAAALVVAGCESVFAGVLAAGVLAAGVLAADVSAGGVTIESVDAWALVPVAVALGASDGLEFALAVGCVFVAV